MKPKIKLPDPVITEQGIWAGDKLERGQYAQNIREMLADETEAVVVAVNGKWGCGKTFFLERFAKEYAKDGKGGVCIYLNAWECDYLSNPLLFLLSGIQETVSDQLNGALFDPQLRGQISDLFWKLAKNILGIIPFGIGEGIKEASETNLLSFYPQQTKLNNRLREILSALAKEIKSKTEKPMVICVDELDRCRPTYAIEMLERIKHFFDIPGIVFMLGLDREQLCASIASVYGAIDTENYLHRFFDFEFVLPPPDRAAFIAEQFKQYGLTACWEELDRAANIDLSVHEGANCQQTIQFLAAVHRLELREIQTALKWLAILVRTQKPRYYSFPFLAIVLIILKLRNRELYGKYLKGTATPADVLDFLVPKEKEMDWRSVDIRTFEHIVLGVYCSFIKRHEREPHVYLKILQQAAQQQTLTEEQNATLPWFLQGAENAGELKNTLERLGRADDWDAPEHLGSDALQSVVARLETLGWKDMK